MCNQCRFVMQHSGAQNALMCFILLNQRKSLGPKIQDRQSTHHYWGSFEESKVKNGTEHLEGCKLPLDGFLSFSPSFRPTGALCLCCAMRHVICPSAQMMTIHTSRATVMKSTTQEVRDISRDSLSR